MITLVNQLAVSVVVTVDSVGIGDHTSPRCPVDIDDLTDNYSIQTWRLSFKGLVFWKTHTVYQSRKIVLRDTPGLSVEGE